MTTLIALTKSLLISGLLFGYYTLFLKNRFIHGFNRFFLLSIPLISLVLPFLHFSLPEFWNQTGTGSPIRLLGVGQGAFEDAVTVYANRRSTFFFSGAEICLIISLMISAFLCIRLIRSILYLIRLQHNHSFVRIPGARIYFVEEPGTPFSFFRSIFWGKDMNMETPAGQQILKHELFHVNNHHSMDLLFMEFFSILFWFNPFFHQIRNELRAVHEYDADQFTSTDSDEFEYARLLVTGISAPHFFLSHPFFKNHIKRRIAMITKTTKNRKALIERLMILPLLTLIFGIFSFTFKNHSLLSGSKTIRVVVDAGHGGSFTGAQASGMNEKDINLLIAKKIQLLSKEYQVDVIMSRESDVTPGSNELRGSLEYIAALPKNENADLFISIHTNMSEQTTEAKTRSAKSGFQIYIPRNSSLVYENSVRLGSAMTEVIKSDFNIESELKQPEDGNVYVLKNATVPAILIECGYMDNPSDLKYLQDKKSQEKIARDILEGIRRYAQQPLSFVESNAGTSFQAPITFTHDSTEPMKKVEVPAVYPGGGEGWSKYLVKNLNYPEAAQDNEVQGDVMVEFIVHADGSVSNAKAISGPKLLQAESLRVVSQSGKWVPAQNHGVNVDAYTYQPIHYRLSVSK